MHIVFAVFFAISTAAINCLTSFYILETVENFSEFGNANGIINMFRGLGCFFGPILTGLVYEIDKTCLLPFILGGCLMGIGTVFSIIGYVLKSFRDARNILEC